MAWRTGSLLVVLVAWEIIGRSGLNPVFPSLTSTLAALWTLVLNGQLFSAVWLSSLTLMAGFGVSLATGIPLGLLMGRYRSVAKLAGPYIAALMAAPSVAYIPLLVIWFGTGLASRIMVVYLFAFFPVVINTEAGVRNSDARLVEMARSLLATPRQIFLKVVLPAAIPLIFAGVRLSLGRAVKGMVNAEMLITLVGMGGLIRFYGSSFQTDFALALTLTVVIFAVVLTMLLRMLDRVMTRWMPEVSRA
ncbi:MAG: ABC transporter permease [Deltaproteobacteria bacterium]|nr:ABC transporter permease [Deltaproteobacteria bacterium]